MNFDRKLLRKLFEFWRHLSPPTLFVTSFAALIGICTAGFLVLPGLYTKDSLGFLDALFTSTSAVCVTGLIVVDTATHFTLAGQLWVLLFIQLGGLGLITLTTVIIGAMGRRLSLRSEMIAVPTTSHPEGRPEVSSVAMAVAKFTLLFEVAGALLLWLAFLPDFGPVGAIWHAAFHAVSAFCNAGFSTFSSSLVGYAQRPFVPLIISVLVVFGGLGYLTIEEVLRWWRRRKLRAPRRLSSHSFAALSTSAALLVFGAVLFAIFEWNGVLGKFGLLDKLVNAWFMSVTPRTAGFNTIAYADVENETAFLTILLMTIGGSPGSTAGGVKTTTLAILIALAAARMRGRRFIELHSRTVPDSTVQRTVSILLLGFSLVTSAIFLLNVTETHARGVAYDRAAAIPLMFEVVSAFGTVGLSMDATPVLGVAGKLIIIALMFLGRVGPLAFFAALSFKSSRLPAGMRSAREDVIIG